MNIKRRNLLRNVYFTEEIISFFNKKNGGKKTNGLLSQFSIKFCGIVVSRHIKEYVKGAIKAEFQISFI